MKSVEENEVPILTTIQHIKDGTINPRTLDKETRQQCIEVMVGQGYNNSQIAQFLGRSDKTIQRDLGEIRRKHTLAPNPTLATEIVGELLLKARNYEGNLNQLARSKDGTVAEKAQAQFLAWRVWKECVEKLQTLGYLPLKPQEIRGDFYHTHSEAASPEQSAAEIQGIINDIEQNLGDNADPAMLEEVNKLKLKFESAKLAGEAQAVLEKQKQIIQDGEDSSNV